ncbi:gliding motility lipoprotein GldH [Candidatus Sulfidibacterium hydrothermale]|uniref:gliding motility lipoprotein GldH n=1 Tax=Candidatus Sulfidibacterium hydrothermale TaxID=2875962 RepID=UPI001F0A6228|nr:gliding motility lipoprotein GldH [Candidatus Sulfidibacterium hydrothermale]UBM63315.1 gliding motility lipoprotein GldH [Candidatus Sulfidibacterium hydrothermale]
MIRHLKKEYGLLLIIIGLLFFTSCRRSTLFAGAVPLNGVWPKESAAKFVIPVSDTVSLYDFYVNIRHTQKYRYSNLYLFMETLFPNKTYTRDTLEIMLANPEGKWLGKGWGKIKEDHVLLKSKFRFPLKGKYTFLIWQGMRTDTLHAVQSVGIDIEKSK